MAVLFVGVPPPSEGTPEGWRARWLTRVGVYGALFAGLTLLPLGARLSWLCEVTTHFRLQYAVILAAASATLALGRRWPSALALAGFAAGNASMVAPAVLGGPAPVGAQATARATIVSYNVFSGNATLGEAAAYLRGAAPDILMLYEVSDAVLRGLKLVELGYLPLAVEPRGDNYGLALYVKKDGAAVAVPGTARIAHFGSDSIGTAVGEFTVGGKRLAVAGAHAAVPTSDDSVARRDATLHAAVRWAQERGGAGVVAGDFNATPYTPVFGDLLKDHGFVNGGAGFGFGLSWPAWFWPLAIPIDHILVGPGVAVLARDFGPSSGSDHRPLRAAIAF